MTPPNRPFETEMRPCGRAALAEAARLIAAGLPVAVPTETVYGLAADATSGAAVARIYEAKGRPGFNPLIVHVRSLDEAEAIGTFSDPARALGAAYWPGPLTIVVPRTPGCPVADLATAGLDTVAVRCPGHPVMRALIEAAGRPIAAPSANASGSISPTTADHVMASLGGRIPLILDGGPSKLGLESTIVGISGGTLELLRPGPIPFDGIAALARLSGSAALPGRITAPGQMRSHYAPTKPLRLDAQSAEPGEWLIGFGAVAGDDSLSRSGDLVEAAARLFGALHRAEASARPRIAVAPVPQRGVGVAINDRLRRAAAPRSAG